MKSTTIVRALIAAAVLVTSGAQAQSSVYRWVDKDGKIHFSDTPPPQDAKSSSHRTLGGGYAQDSQLPYATQVAMKRNPVMVYTSTDCGDVCGRARDLLSRRGIPFTEKNVQASRVDADALRKLAGSQEVDVPFLVVGENKFKGYEEDTWNSALDTAGYPRTRLPGQVTAPTPAPAAPPSKPPENAPGAEPSPSK
jgi:glutaredoxin